MTLNASILARLRNQTAKFLKDTCLIEVQDQSTDEYGSPALSWSVVAEDVPCRMITAGYQNQSRAGLVGSQESLQDMYKLICPYGTALDIDQRVTVNGQTYNVVQLMTARTDETDTQAIIVRQR